MEHNKRFWETWMCVFAHTITKTESIFPSNYEEHEGEWISFLDESFLNIPFDPTMCSLQFKTRSIEQIAKRVEDLRSRLIQFLQGCLNINTWREDKLRYDTVLPVTTHWISDLRVGKVSVTFISVISQIITPKQCKSHNAIGTWESMRLL